MDLNAIKAGNVVSSSMIKHKSLMASSHFYNFFNFFNIFLLRTSARLSAIPGCAPENATYCLDYEHFKGNSSLAVDYGYAVSEPEHVKKKSMQRRQDQTHTNLKPLTVRAPPELHIAKAFIVEQPVEVILASQIVGY